MNISIKRHGVEEKKIYDTNISKSKEVVNIIKTPMCDINII